MRSMQPQAPLQWPFAPAKPKVAYVRALHGFERGGGSASVFRAIAGSNEKANDMFLLPVDIAVGRDGRIAVADMGRQCVHLYMPVKKQYLCLAGSDKTKLVSPVSVAFDDELNLYASDSTGGIYIFSSNGAFRSLLQKAGNDVLKRPTGIAYNPNGKLLYVADTLANKIYAYDQNGNLAFSFGERGEKQGQFNYPTHLFYSSSGTLYVTDSMNFRIQIFSESGKFVTSFGHHGDGSGDLARPKGVAADKDGVVYVVDSLFDNVQLFDEKGTFLLTLGSRGNDFGEFWLPSGISIDGDALYICDTYNHRVQVFQIAEQYP